MSRYPSRRSFLAAAGCAAALFPACNVLGADDPVNVGSTDIGFPLMDLHVHLDNSTIDTVIELCKPRNVKFGIVEHAGTKLNVYPKVLSNDQELTAYLAMLDGKGVYKGVQAEWTDWMGCFSKPVLARLDYILTDAMTYPGKDGQRVKLWEKGVEDRVEMSSKQVFMDRYVDWYVQTMAKQPIDILANVSWLPADMMADYDAYWTAKRMQTVIDAFVKYKVAMEISSSFKLPRLPMLKQAKEAGLKFSFGSNGRYPKMGLLDYSIATARELKLTAADMFTPAPDGQRAAQRREWQ